MLQSLVIIHSILAVLDPLGNLLLNMLSSTNWIRAFCFRLPYYQIRSHKIWAYSNNHPTTKMHPQNTRVLLHASKRVRKLPTKQPHLKAKKEKSGLG